MPISDEERRRNNFELEARRRAVKMWREHEMSYGKDAKVWAIKDCEAKIKKAYTRDYKDFWLAVKVCLEKHAP